MTTSGTGDRSAGLRTGSEKLVDRARRIVAEAGGVPPAVAGRLLDAAGGEVKTAILMARLEIGPATARERLARSGGHLHRALADAGG